MKIRKLFFREHPVLGNLHLDFTDFTTGDVFNTIILAGENGSGKTLILNEIYTTLGEYNLNKRCGITAIEFEIDGATLEFLREKLSLPALSPPGNIINVRQEYNSPGNWINLVFSMQDGVGHDVIRSSHEYLLPPENLRPFRVFFSEAEIDFRAVPLEAIRATEVDDSVSARRSALSWLVKFLSF
jgi:hypothetical protein